SDHGNNNGVHKKKAKPKPTIDWAAYLHQHRSNAREVLLLARILGVHPDALRRLQMGYVPEADDEPNHWLFPERDAEARVIGLLRRFANGKKRRMAGASSGLIFEETNMKNRKTITDMLLIVEGPTDVAAAFTMGLNAVGRPNNMGGAELLAALLNRLQLAEGV